MQVAIDNAKRRFDINLTAEIDRIKRDMDIKTYKYPSFWGVIKKNFNKSNINSELICPMNYLCGLKMKYTNYKTSTLSMDYFFDKYKLDKNRKSSKKVEELIEKYSIKILDYNSGNYEEDDDYLLLRSNFEELIFDIKSTYISSTYLGLFSWLIDRAFVISSEALKHKSSTKSVISKNKSLLFKAMYEINPDNLIKCLSKNIKNRDA